MNTRKEYLDPVIDELVTFIPHNFPDFKQFQGIEYYDYYKVNQWFPKNKRLLLCRWGHCCDCEDFTPEIKEQQCQHDPETWDIETCHRSTGSANK